MTSPRLLLLFVTVAAVVVVEASWIGGMGQRWWNPTSSRAPVFRGRQFFNISELVGLSRIAGHIAAFGDFDSDRL
jgi:hypothetical protein